MIFSFASSKRFSWLWMQYVCEHVKLTCLPLTLWERPWNLFLSWISFSTLEFGNVGFYPFLCFFHLMFLVEDIIFSPSGVQLYRSDVWKWLLLLSFLVWKSATAVKNNFDFFSHMIVFCLPEADFSGLFFF